MIKFYQKKIQCIYVVWIICLNFVCCGLEVKITDGILKGKVLQSRDGRPYYSYTGIPYAKPPIGELRFKAPKAAESWNGTLDATKESSTCVQNEGGQEDCLYLNVYSPIVNKKFLPVMFWIHGGKFTQGHSGPSRFGPEYFMDKDVVLVSINYRLGIFGYLSAEDDVILGNYGMKDQVMALLWVQKNIVNFNGDSNQITIFGESSGGASVGYHILSPMSKGLFHKAILQSGTPVCLWAVPSPGFARKSAHAIATIAGCSYKASEDILECLRKLPADYLVNLSNKLSAWLEFPTVQFYPVVENCNNNKEAAFLCNHPIYDFKQESFVPVIIGLNSDEGGAFTSPLYNCTSLIHPELRINFNRLLSLMLQYYQYTSLEDLDKIGELILKEYFPSGSVDDDTHSNLANVFSDGCFTQCILNMAKQLSSPVYSYFYDYKNECSKNKLLGSCEKYLGVVHGDELISLFSMSSSYSKNLSTKDLEVSKTLVNIWYKFASSEFPTIDGTDGGAVWPQFSSNEKSPFLHINSTQPKIIQNPFEKKYQFWNQLFFDHSSAMVRVSQKLSSMKTEL